MRSTVKGKLVLHRTGDGVVIELLELISGYWEEHLRVRRDKAL